jgi:hypothetical protein
MTKKAIYVYFSPFSSLDDWLESHTHTPTTITTTTATSITHSQSRHDGDDSEWTREGKGAWSARDMTLQDGTGRDGTGNGSLR